MELAIPLIALGGLYVYSNKKDEDEDDEIIQEGMTNSLPNTNVPPVNFPVLEKVKNTNVNKFKQPNATTDRFFRPSIFNDFKNGPDQFGNISKESEVKLLSGEMMDKTDFKHNNMAPFFGAKIRGRTADANLNESILDNMVGTGSQNFDKVERAPLFKPQPNMQFANGAPNMSDFYESRVNPGMNMANVKPFQSEQVGPGLNQGYSNKGTGGFNSGMEARDKWVDRNVDQLRTKTNPKISYGLDNHQGPANNWIKNAPSTATQGSVEKYQPDTFFINTPDRWLTTTGLEKGQTARSNVVQKDVNRTSTTEEYFGIGANTDSSASYINGHYEDSKKQQLDCKPIGVPNMTTQNKPSTGDYSRDSYKNRVNNRCVSNSERMGNFAGSIKSAVAPIFNILRPTRKQDLVGNCRIYGDVNTSVSKPTIFNPNDRAPTTIRETTEKGINDKHLNLERQATGAYHVSKQTPITNERDTTSMEYVGNANINTGAATYNAAYNQTNNVNKTYINRPNQGGTSLLNNYENIHISKNEKDRNNNRFNVPNGGINNAIPSVETMGKIHMPQYYDNCKSCERINPDILTAFKENPYTQSLSSY